jgi:glycosyltransferase involved in cell wall biosynthesis
MYAGARLTIIMLAYVLPGTGIYGGIKKGFHCADMLTSAGHPCVVATPDGGRPTWFPTACAVTTHAALAHDCRPEDVILFSCPADAPFVDGLPARRKIVHMQGANTAADHALFDAGRGYEFISHGLHMTYELQRHGRVAPYVPMGIPDVFHWRGEFKAPLRVAVMPRKGGALLAAVRAALPPGCGLICIDGLPEPNVADILKRADVFLAISASEAFGLPPLEAMCARCCVVGFPGVGGFEFMRHGDTAHVVANGDTEGLIEALRHVCAAPAYRDALRERAAALAAHYTMDRERAALLRALGLADAP